MKKFFPFLLIALFLFAFSSQEIGITPIPVGEKNFSLVLKFIEQNGYLTSSGNYQLQLLVSSGNRHTLFLKTNRKIIEGFVQDSTSQKSIFRYIITKKEVVYKNINKSGLGSFEDEKNYQELKDLFQIILKNAGSKPVNKTEDKEEYSEGIEC